MTSLTSFDVVDAVDAVEVVDVVDVHYAVDQWKGKASVRKETVVVSATRPKIVRKNQNTLPPHLLSQPVHEVEVCQRREASEAKVTMDPFFDNRVDIKRKGTCTRTPCEYWHPPECQFYETKTPVVSQETRVCFRITRLMNNQTKAPKEHKNAVAVVKIVSQMGCFSQDLGIFGLSKRQTGPGKPDAKSLGTDSKNTIH